MREVFLLMKYNLTTLKIYFKQGRKFNFFGQIGLKYRKIVFKYWKYILNTSKSVSKYMWFGKGRQAVFYNMVRTLLNCSFRALLKLYVIGHLAGHVQSFPCPHYHAHYRKHFIAGLFTVLFISNACSNFLQELKRSILLHCYFCSSWKRYRILFCIIYFPRVISCHNRFSCQQNTWLNVHSSDTSRYTANTRAIIAY